MNTLTKVAISHNRENRTRSILIILSVFLTSLLLTVIAVWGYGLVKSNRVNAGSLYGNYYGLYQGITKEQMDTMKLHNEFTDIGVMGQAGMVKASEDLSLVYADETALLLTNQREKLAEGAFPKKENEIAAQASFFQKLGVQEPRVGKAVTITFRTDLNSRYTDHEFIICGLLKEEKTDGLQKAFAGYLSESFYKGQTEEESRRYNVFFRLSSSLKITSDTAEDTIKELGAKCGIEEKQVFANDYYLMWALNPGVETISVCLILAILVILFSIVVIYNIFQVGMVQKIQEYGKLKALGAARGQLKKIIFREGMMLAMIGMPFGLLTGYILSCLTFGWVMEQADKINEGINEKSVSLFSFPLLFLAGILSLAAVWAALKKPMKKVAALSPVEAIGYREAEGAPDGRRKGRKSLGTLGITLANLSVNRKRNLSTICTMGLSCILFVAVSSFTGNMDDEYNARRSVEYGQFCISLEYSLSDSAYPENNLDAILENNPLSEELVEDIKAIPGVTDIKTRKILAVRLEKDGAESQLMSVLVLNREEFDKESKYGITIGETDYDKAARDKSIIYGWAYFMEDSGYSPGDKVILNFTGRNAGKHLKTDIKGSFAGIDTYWAITEETFESLALQGNMTGYLWVDCKKKDIEAVREKLERAVEGKAVELTSFQEELSLSRFSTGFMKMGVYTFLALIGLIGFLNMANTIIISIITRKREFGILQAVGMTNRQLNFMLQAEGLLFTAGTAMLALALGTPIGYGIFCYGKSHGWIGLNVYHFPAAEIGMLTAVMALLQIVLSFLLSRNLKKNSLVDRIRYLG